MATIEGVRLGRYGIWTFDFETRPASRIRESARELEELGWPALWIPETDGREALTHAGFLLAATDTLTVVNGIAQIGSREPRRTQGGALLLADAYPDRHLLGLGFGGSPGPQPLAAVREYLEAMDAVTNGNPAPRAPVRRLLAAYGPKMLELARDHAAGAHTYHVTPGHTAQAREILGDGPFLGVEHAVLFETDAAKAREIARGHLHPYLTQPYNIAKFRRLGYTQEEIDGAADRIVDDLVFWGDLETVTAKLGAHLDAGADHVGIQVIGIAPGESAMPHWRRLAEALLPVAA
ncbi:probable F420-dependent oxidoreductase, MSMEG_4141 family [Amycolatopsis pretoriensis]|uniref:Probable F420-dependent oxidoreductase, MSMEG_4141 family n=1 Tax=Amycolatopsis pretoriensis TaxID=218821 RepID=A0A1H5Q7X0_9PSEU|nr:TIGR03620 family F420-dependent LLM class oxidoreductase [Amycolatopsis pretoriensis]SEF22166.1 probable F420-dependent oxidoreductase, MSMEG_4141 family [Amycolatopsis pretoriensis]